MASESSGDLGEGGVLTSALVPNDGPAPQDPLQKRVSEEGRTEGRLCCSWAEGRDHEEN